MMIKEQINNLQEIGLIINDEEYAEKILNDILYFRLKKAYSLNLKVKNGNYSNSVTFEHLVELYLFNVNFRQILFLEIEKIEINIRCRISNYFADTYVRNMCAHYGRLYNAKSSKTPILYKEYTQAGIGNNLIFGLLLCIRILLKKDSHWNKLLKV